MHIFINATYSIYITTRGFKRTGIIPQIIEFGLRKNNSIQLGSFELERSENLQIFFTIDGKFDWMVNRQTQFLYPGNTALVLPGQEIGGDNLLSGVFWDVS